MDDPLRSPRLRLSSAYKGINDLQEAFNAFIDDNPYAQIIEHDANKGLDIHKVKLTRLPDEQLSVDVVRVAEDLRAALDHLGFALAVAGGAPVVTKCAYFPFASDAQNLDTVIKRRCKDVPPDIQAVFRGFKPYKGGDDLLYALNVIANCGKHRVIHPIAHAVSGQEIHHGHFEAVTEMFIPAKWDSANDEVIIFTCPHGAKANYQISLTLFIAFGDIDIVRGQEVLGVLYTLARKVDGIVTSAEARAKEAGLIK